MFKNECSRNCWLAAAVFGLLVWLFNATLVGGFVLGLIAFFLLGSTLIWLVCSGRGGAAEDAEVLAGRKTAPVPAGDGVLDRAEQAVIDASNAFAAGTVAAVAKGREALHDLRDEVRDRDNDDDDDDDRKARHADHDDDDDESILERAEERLEKAGEAMKDAMEALAARGKEAIGTLTSTRADAAEALPAVEPVTLVSEPAPPADQPVVAEPVAKTGNDKTGNDNAEKPKAAKDHKPKAGAKPDDLKEIKGVGPALEALLHENDVTSFTQIAGWTDTDIDHYAELIGRMGGRIRSDDWVAQAKVLAAGGETEFSRRVDKGEVY